MGIERYDDGRVIFGRGAQAQAAVELRARGAERVLVVSTPGRRGGADALAAALGDRSVGVLAIAQPQVPAEVAAKGVDHARRVDADWVVAHGGGTPIGLAKAIALEVDVKVGAITTTYAGSEMTNIYGITTAGVKTTGRDDRVRPSLVVYDPTLVDTLPQKVAAASVVNALAHAVEALYAHEAEAWVADVAEDASAALFGALSRLDTEAGRERAMYGAYLAGKVLDAASMGAQHKLAHTLGGSFKVPHHAAHSVLLPHVIAANLAKASVARDRLRRAFGSDDPAASLWDAAHAAGVPTRLRDFGFDESSVEEAVALALTKKYPNPRDLAAGWLTQLLMDAVQGRRPGLARGTVALDPKHARGIHAGLRAVRGGTPLHRARGAVILMHGRGATAEGLLDKVLASTHHRDVAFIAPQAWGNSWYPKGYRQEGANVEPRESAWSVIDALVARVTQHVPLDRVVVAGFSQGACLSLSWLSRHTDKAPGGIATMFGAADPQCTNLPDVSGMHAYFSGAFGDSWVDAGAIEASADFLSKHGVHVNLALREGAHRLEPSDFHHLTQLMEAVVQGNDLQYQTGFGAHHQTEAIPGTLPPRQNTPRKVAKGLYAEAINGTGFTVERAHNRVTWMYRLRPQLYLAPWEPTTLNGGRFTGRFSEGLVSPELLRFKPMPYPDEEVDFLDGLTTFAGAGDPSQRAGMAIHIYSATKAMDNRAFVNLDGDLLLVPQDGAIRVRTELGWLQASPGHLVILPRGIRFQVHPQDGKARGWVSEIFNGHYQLPERGLLGANGLASERHFKAPVASYEATDATYEVIQKQGGDLWRNAKAVSPFDVVAWHGTYAPFVYDLDDFMAYGSVTFDHPDPSVLTVLTCPMDTHGRNVIDVAVFKGRWDVTEDTFRPPYFHRNSAIEFNAVVKSPSTAGPYQAGAVTYTPYLVPHGVSSRNYKHQLEKPDDVANKPHRLSDDEMWVQFESTYPLRVMPWMYDHPQRDNGYLDQFEGFEAVEP